MTERCEWRVEEAGVPPVNRKTTDRSKRPRSVPACIRLQEGPASSGRRARAMSCSLASSM